MGNVRYDKYAIGDCVEWDYAMIEVHGHFFVLDKRGKGPFIVTGLFDVPTEPGNLNGVGHTQWLIVNGEKDYEKISGNFFKPVRDSRGTMLTSNKGLVANSQT